MQDLRALIQDVPDFPSPGVMFRDVSPLLRKDFGRAIDALSALFSEEEWKQIDVVAGIESRGLVFASSLAFKQNKGVALIRKAGKLPNVVAHQKYDLEYGSAALEAQAGYGRCLIVDDVMATGGTLTAAADLCTQAGYNVAHLAVFINLAELNDFRWQGQPARAVLTY
jgi:adenine phosphoribosyltransferase